jgi:hypothetical protein
VDILCRALERVNDASHWFAARAFERVTIRQFNLHKLCDRAKVADAYKAGAKDTLFHQCPTQSCDQRIVSFKANDVVSICTLEGRLKTKSVRGQRRRDLLQLQTFVASKARHAGIPVLFVDPKYTRKGCPACGAIDDGNRANQATFSRI